ncbi:hypothetical protein ACH4E8_14865 [Streptomyces sp. NPDC017979]|uniref:hypothetical protein n=1 Tax=Streptomyces sp. NPDC017979 TaxID=3365024 RepID=UPI0037A3B2E7
MDVTIGSHGPNEICPVIRERGTDFTVTWSKGAEAEGAVAGSARRSTGELPGLSGGERQRVLEVRLRERTTARTATATAAPWTDRLPELAAVSTTPRR